MRAVAEGEMETMRSPEMRTVASGRVVAVAG
jgi:hypothetical protein